MARILTVFRPHRRPHPRTGRCHGSCWSRHCTRAGDWPAERQSVESPEAIPSRIVTFAVTYLALLITQATMALKIDVQAP